MASSGPAEWRTDSEYVWRRIRRSIVSGGAVVGYSDGSVMGWLPKEQSDYISEGSGRAAALWHGMLSWKTALTQCSLPLAFDCFALCHEIQGHAWLHYFKPPVYLATSKPYIRTDDALIHRVFCSLQLPMIQAPSPATKKIWRSLNLWKAWFRWRAFPVTLTVVNLDTAPLRS